MVVRGPKVVVPIYLGEDSSAMVPVGGNASGIIENFPSYCRVMNVTCRPSARTTFNLHLYRDGARNKPVYSYDHNAVSGTGIIDAPDFLYQEDGDDERIYWTINNDATGAQATFDIEVYGWSGGQG